MQAYISPFTGALEPQTVRVRRNEGSSNRVCLGDGTGSFACSDVSSDTNDTIGVALAPAAPPPPPPVNTFIDDDDHFAENAIEWLAAEGITVGCNPPDHDKCCPNDFVSRGEMAVFLARAYHLPATSTDYFTDDDGRF